jgi:hypothetical protein
MYNVPADNVSITHLTNEQFRTFLPRLKETFLKPESSYADNTTFLKAEFPSALQVNPVIFVMNEKGRIDFAGIIPTEIYRSHQPDKAPRLVIYYAKENDLDINLEKVELRDYKLLTEDHIESYDWDTHTITLTKEGSRRIPSSSLRGVRGRSFVIVADGQRCYLGAFWSSLSSTSCPVPVINILRQNPYESGKIQIERAYPSAKFGQGEDPRFDERIKKVLEETGKLTYSKPESKSVEGVAHLSAAEALRMADEFAAERMAKYKNFDLKFYPNRSAKFQAEWKNWYVSYRREPNRWVGDHFSVYVDDATGELKYIGGRYSAKVRRV